MYFVFIFIIYAYIYQISTNSTIHQAHSEFEFRDSLWSNSRYYKTALILQIKVIKLAEP